MARPKSNGNGRLEDAMARLAESQAKLDQSQTRLEAKWEQSRADMQKSQQDLHQAQILMTQNMNASMQRLTELERATAERFSRVEGLLLQHSQVLAELIRMLERLPEAVREQIGFRAPAQPS